ncbi:minor tail protein [Mycobacterium phage Gaia]|uniref:Minor tail protein n=1 Tax=Mycobacterium phage Gaia TaxID=1486472 RepID=A0A068F3D1_9CAUD|nr:minor tail protein [Mycobacterium phage Gaia]AID58843.1 minor tail protein [Mycobacterium phage Gaia]
MIGWWAERHVGFTVELSPQVGFVYGGPSQEFGIILSPEVGMSAVSHSRATFGLELSPAIGASASSHSVASFGLTLDPYIAMRGPGSFTPLFPSENLFPSYQLFPTPRSQRPGFGLSLSPSLGFSAEVGYSREFSLTVTPELGMSAAERYSSGFGVEVTPQIGMQASERYAREFTVEVSPTIGMDAVGNNGVDPVEFDAASIVNFSTADFTYTHTATAGAAVVVAVLVTGNGTMNGVTYGGTPMSSMGSVSVNNNAATGTLWLYFLDNVPGGMQDIDIDKNGFGWCRSAASSYLNVDSCSMVDGAYGSSITANHPATSTPGGMVVYSVGITNNSAISLSGGNTRANASNTGGSLLVGDSIPDATFSATFASSQAWASGYVVLSPA